jgi:transcriptional regulator with XRE-family HTH domain
MTPPLIERDVDKRVAGTPPDSADRADRGAPALGELLRRARESRGLTLQQISDETRIPLRHLDALERGNVTAIPGGFYRRAEIRAYAEVVHLDPNLALARLEGVVTPPPVPVAPPKPLQADGPFLLRKTTAITLALFAAGAILGLAAWKRPPAARDTNVQERGVASAPRLPDAAPALPAPTLRDALVGQTGPTRVDQPAAPSDAANAADLDGELVVTTAPPGARVTVDGIGWGVTPITIRHLPLGTKRVRVTKDGYRAAERVVPLDADHATIRLRVPLQTVP